MRVRFLKPAPDCNIWRCVPSPQSIRKRYSSCLTICAERPRWAEGAEAEVPRNNISNKLTFSVDHQRTGTMSNRSRGFFGTVEQFYLTGCCTTKPEINFLLGI